MVVAGYGKTSEMSKLLLPPQQLSRTSDGVPSHCQCREYGNERLRYPLHPVLPFRDGNNTPNHPKSTPRKQYLHILYGLKIAERKRWHQFSSFGDRYIFAGGDQYGKHFSRQYRKSGRLGKISIPAKHCSSLRTVTFIRGPVLFGLQSNHV